MAQTRDQRPLPPMTATESQCRWWRSTQSQSKASVALSLNAWHEQKFCITFCHAIHSNSEMPFHLILWAKHTNTENKKLNNSSNKCNNKWHLCWAVLCCVVRLNCRSCRCQRLPALPMPFDFGDGSANGCANGCANGGVGSGGAHMRAERSRANQFAILILQLRHSPHSLIHRCFTFLS